MRKVWTFSFLLLLSVALCALFTSCATTPKTEYITVTETETQTMTETEYVPMYIDLNDTIKTVIDQRPDNSTYVIRTGKQLKTSWDLMYNSYTYQCAWEAWQAYAELLEDTLYTCRDMCQDPNTIQPTEGVIVEEVQPTSEDVQTPETTITTQWDNTSSLNVPLVG